MTVRNALESAIYKHTAWRSLLSSHMCIVQTVRPSEISFSLSAVSLVSGVDRIRQPDVQSLVVLCQGGVMVVHDQILQRLVEVEGLDEAVAALRVANHAVPHLAADAVDEETRAGLGKRRTTTDSIKN